MKHRVYIANTNEDFNKAKEIVLAYAKFLNADLSFQNFDDEMKAFDQMYDKPHGSMLLAEVSGEIVGAVGLRFFSKNVAEMKRMFVLPKCQGFGIGNTLMSAFIDQAKSLGYLSIKLDTIAELDKAIHLYKKYQFVSIDPYRYNPHPEAQFYELDIS